MSFSIKTEVTSDQYIYLFKYGVVCFVNNDDIKVSDFINLITPYCKNFFGTKMWEDYYIETGAGEIKIGNNKIQLINTDRETIRRAGY